MTEEEPEEGTCLRCGRHAPLHRGLCLDCFRETSEIFSIPDYLDITVCRSCGALLKGKHWEYGGELTEIIEEEVHSSLRELAGVEVSLEEVKISRGGEGLYHVEVSAVANFPGGGLIPARKALTLRVAHSLCPRCSRIHGSYYEAIIQIRGGGKAPLRQEEALDRVLERIDQIAEGDPMTFVTKLVKVRGGWDVYVGRNQSARRIAQEMHRLYGGEYKVSSKLVGRREGRDLKRFTYLVRLPPWRRGDYILKDGAPHRIEGFQGSKVKLKNMQTQREESVEISAVGGLTHYPREEVEMEATVLYTSDEEITIMDPVSFAEVCIKKPPEWGKKDVVRIVRIEEDVYLLQV